MIGLPDVGPYLVEDEVYGYDSWWMSFLPGFAMMVRDHYPSRNLPGSLSDPIPTQLGAFDIQEFGGAANPNVIAALFMLFMYFVQIVLLNLLIAIMVCRSRGVLLS